MKKVRSWPGAAWAAGVQSRYLRPYENVKRWPANLSVCVTALFALLAMSGCASKGSIAASGASQPITSSYTPAVKPEIAYASIAINDLEPNIATAEITVTLANPNPLEASVHSFRWTVYYKDKGSWQELGQGLSESRQVQPNNSTTFNLAITGPVTSAGVAKFPKIDAFSSGEDVQLMASGAIPVDIGSSHFAIPFDISRDFANPQQ